MKEQQTPRALISVWDKDGIGDLALALTDAGYEIISSSGTAKYLRGIGIAVTEVADLTGLPSILGGRVKTLHPKIMGGILARRGHSDDKKDVKEHGIPLIDFVVCTLYPFEETAKKSASKEELIEKIDIGGVSLIRAAAKNYERVAVVTDPADYELMARAVRNGDITDNMRKNLAIKAFLVTSSYDATIYDGLTRELGEPESSIGAYSRDLMIPLRKEQDLRYGENPYQKAAIYMPTLAGKVFEQHSGKELSYNNMLDLDTLLKGTEIFKGKCACIIVKHTTPCGVAQGVNDSDAYEKALASDPISAFGGIAGFTQKIDVKLAEKLFHHFFEVIAAPAFDDGALKILGAKKNLRLLTITGNYNPKYQITANRTGFLVQNETLPPKPSLSEGRWEGTPRPDLWDELIFAWRTVSIVKSNAIVLANDFASIGIGSGFPNRVDAASYAIAQAGHKAKGSVMASDAFFPFPDTVELAAEAGVTAIIQPGGSIKDPEVAQRAVELGISMFVGGPRTFRH
ncbi:bifunctional purine biosynthesis protein PurH [Synergistales bacterium]|nr:bifunctional purine biosynthesis protein PurH [Synergistales bacterium]